LSKIDCNLKETSSDGGQSDTADLLTPAAQRALLEAANRRSQVKSVPVAEVEIGGRGGLDPSRYGDWEVKGITSDF
jgi:hypothetical protein